MENVPNLPFTPNNEDEFTADWVQKVASDYLKGEEENSEEIGEPIIKEVWTKKNELQGILSTTYIVKFKYHFQGDDGQEREKSIFVKVPLKGELAKN